MSLDTLGMLQKCLFVIKVLYKDSGCVTLVVFEKQMRSAVELEMEYPSDTVVLSRENLPIIFVPLGQRQCTVEYLMPTHFFDGFPRNSNL